MTGEAIFKLANDLNKVRAAELTGDFGTTAKIEPLHGVSTTEYRITGSLAEVQKAIAVLFGQYHPAGYGTRVHAIEYVYEGGTYAARMSRSNSCE